MTEDKYAYMQLTHNSKIHVIRDRKMLCTGTPATGLTWKYVSYYLFDSFWGCKRCQAKLAKEEEE